MMKGRTLQVIDRFNKFVNNCAAPYGNEKLMRPESDARNDDSAWTNNNLPAIKPPT